MQVDFVMATTDAVKKFMDFVHLIGMDWMDPEKLFYFKVEIEFFQIPDIIEKYSGVITPGISDVFESGFEFYLCDGKVEKTVFCSINNIKRFGDFDNKRLISLMKGYDKIT